MGWIDDVDEVRDTFGELQLQVTPEQADAISNYVDAIVTAWVNNHERNYRHDSM